MASRPCERCGLVHPPEGPCAAPDPGTASAPETQDLQKAKPRTAPMGVANNMTMLAPLRDVPVTPGAGSASPPTQAPPQGASPPTQAQPAGAGPLVTPPTQAPPQVMGPSPSMAAPSTQGPPLVLGPSPGVAAPSTQAPKVGETMVAPSPSPLPLVAPVPSQPESPLFDPAAPPDALVGEMVGSFKLVRVLGRGGMGAVFLGEHPGIGSKVAIKMLHPMLAARPELVKRFYDEARAVNLIGHENIVSIFDLNQLGANRYYIVMEHLEGRTLAQLLKDHDGERLPLDVTTDILLQLCDALGAAHARDIIHRDLKPENIFLTRRGARENFVKLVDFGIAKLRDEQNAGNETATGILVGTPEYMSPEQADNKPVDARSDLYALGVIAYRLAAGQLPFPEKSIGRLIAAHLEKLPPPPRQHNPELPPAYEAAILRALAKRPAERFQSAAEFAQALDQARGPRPGLTPAPGMGSGFTPAPGSSFTPAPVLTPAPVAGPRVVAGFEVELLAPPPARPLRAADISKGGLFLCADAAFPPLFTRVKLRLPTDAGGLELSGEVVRHVSADEGRAWGMPAGFGVQFVGLGPAEREQLAAVTQRRPAAASTPPVPVEVEPSPPEVMELLGYLSKRFNGSHYDLLGLPPDAECKQVSPVARALEDRIRKALEKARPEHKPPLQVGLERVRSAQETLAAATRRVDYDAHRGNYRGVARCLEAGLSLQELAARHQQFLAQRPGLDVRSQQQLGRIKLARNRGNYPAALREYEASLAQDPMNLELQRGWAEVKRLVESAKPA